MKLKITVLGIFISLMFSISVYANPITTQTEFQNAIQTGEITLGGDITFNGTYISDISGEEDMTLEITAADLYTLSGTSVNTPERLLTKAYNSAASKEFELIIGENVSIESFSIRGTDNLRGTGLGGAIYISNADIDGSSSFILSGGGSFKNNTATGGNASASEEFTSAVSSGLGGAIYSDGDITIKNYNGSFTSNSAISGNATGRKYAGTTTSGLGGAIYAKKSITIDNFSGSFAVNSAKGGNASGLSYPYANFSGQGGAIYSDGDITIKNSSGSFTNNSVTAGNASGSHAETRSSAQGGAIYSEVSLTIENFSGNFGVNSATGGASSGTESNAQSSGQGGAIHGKDITIKNSSGNFFSNTATGGKVSGSFASTSSSGQGGAIHGRDAITINNFSGNFIANSATGGDASNEHIGQGETGSAYADSSGLGGAIYGGIIKISNSNGNFSSNTATSGNIQSDKAEVSESGQGGAIYGHVNVIIENFSGNFIANSATAKTGTKRSGRGGAIYGYRDIILENFEGMFIDNAAKGEGAAVYAGYGGAIYGHADIFIENFSGKFIANRAVGGDNSTVYFGAVAGQGGAIYGNEVITISNSNGSFQSNIATGGASSSPSGLGGAIYANQSITLENFSGMFIANSATGGNNSEASGLGGAIYINATETSSISGGAFLNNSASTSSNKGSSGRGGAIFFNVDADNVELELNSSKEAPLVFSGNTHNIGNSGARYNSIYFGAIGNNNDYNVALSVNVDDGAYLTMLDPMASQPNGFSSPYRNTDITLTVDKTGNGTWILGGHNDMQSKTTWTISEGALQLVEDLNGDIAYINLSDSDVASFTLASGASLIVSFTQSEEAHKIKAKDIAIYGDIVPEDSYRSFEMADEYELLNIDIIDISGTKDIPVTSGEGILKGGVYDYSYDFAWDDDLTYLVFSITGKKYNSTRAGESLLLVPALLNVAGVDFVNLEETKGINLDAIYSATTYKNYNFNKAAVKLGTNVGISDKISAGITAVLSKVNFEGSETNLMAGIFEAGLQFAYTGWLGIDVLANITDADYIYQRSYGAGKYNSTTLKFGAQLSKGLYITEKFSLNPYVSYVWNSIKTSAVKEEGDEMYALYMEAHKENIHTVNAGMNFKFNLTKKSYVEVGAGYVRNFGDLTPKVKAYFVNDPEGETFDVTSTTLDAQLLKVNLKGHIGVSENVSLSLKYTFVSGENTKEHAGNLGFNYNW